MTTISWPTDVISHGGHGNAIRECQMIVTTKHIFSIDLRLVYIKP